jgi:hypothetical protein
MIYFTYNLPPPTNITNMLGNWLNRMPKDDKAIIRIGVSTLCWSIWTYRNNIIFNKQNDTIFCMLFDWLYTGFHLLSYLLPVDQREYMAIRYNRLLTVALNFFFLATG